MQLRLQRAIDAYNSNVAPYTIGNLSANKDITECWTQHHVLNSNKPLALIAFNILSIRPTSMGCEMAFSAMGFPKVIPKDK